MGGERKMVKPEELVSEDRLEDMRDAHCVGYHCGCAYIGSRDIGHCVACKVRRDFLAGAHATLEELNIAAVIPYISGPCHRGFVKDHPSGKCPDLAQTGCPYIRLPGCFFQDGAVLVRKPRCREEAHHFRPARER